MSGRISEGGVFLLVYIYNMESRVVPYNGTVQLLFQDFAPVGWVVMANSVCQKYSASKTTECVTIDKLNASN